MHPPVPPNEGERLQVLACHRLLDTAPEPAFDRITSLAAKIFNVPIALVSLIDADRQWFKSRQGLDVSETSRNTAFCAYTILSNAMLVVPDATLDERFADNPLVTGAPHVRFYAGAPLTTPGGVNLGSLCLIDTAPRQFSEAEAVTLRELAAVTMAAIEARQLEGRLRQEITIHEQTTAALRLVETRYQRIAANTPGMVFQFRRRADGAAEVHFASDACREILGLEPAALLRDPDEYFRLVHPKDKAMRDRLVAESVASMQPLRWEGRHILAAGAVKWLQTSAQPERLPNGDILWDGLILDVTERKRADKRLRMLESSVDNANDAILITDAEPVDEPGPRIIYANGAFLQVTGYREEEIIGQTPRILQGPGTSPEAKAAIRGALERWEPIRIELLNYRKDGSEFWVDLNIVPVTNEKGWYTHWVSVQREISEQRRAGVALKDAKEEAERANRAKSEFLSRMSHELRTPLNAILGFGQLLEMSEPTARQRESISHVLSGGRHLLDLINEVLDLARIESGKLELNFEPVRLASLLEEVLSLVQPLAKPLEVALNIAPAEGSLDGVKVQVDKQRLRQILLNLLSNAIKYNRPAGRVDITCERAEDDGRLRLTVRDNGLGIGERDLPRLFSPFERLDAAKSDVEGTGIGLAISQRLAEAMNGSISVASALNEGSAFTLELPIAEGDLNVPHRDGGDARNPAAAPAVKAPGKTVLYIEDNLSNLRLVERIMALRPAISLLTAMQGKAGLALARERLPDLILLDLHLPDLAGDLLLSSLKEDERTRHLPVVIVTADATTNQVQRLLDLGASSYLTKPLDLPALLRTVDDALV